MHLHEVLADAAYASGANYTFLEAHGITGWILVFGCYKPTIDGFAYDAATDTNTCPAGKPLPFHKVETNVAGGRVKIYRAAYQDCVRCPRKPTCVPKARRKQLTKTVYEQPCQRAWQRQQSLHDWRMRRLRHSTVEPVFGSLIHHYGLRRIGTRSQAGAHKTMPLAAAAFNLKKLLKYRPPQAVSQVLALPCLSRASGGTVARGVQFAESNKPHDARLQASRASSATATNLFLYKTDPSRHRYL